MSDYTEEYEYPLSFVKKLCEKPELANQLFSIDPEIHFPCNKREFVSEFFRDRREDLEPNMSISSCSYEMSGVKQFLDGEAECLDYFKQNFIRFWDTTAQISDQDFINFYDSLLESINKEDVPEPACASCLILKIEFSRTDSTGPAYDYTLIENECLRLVGKSQTEL